MKYAIVDDEDDSIERLKYVRQGVFVALPDTATLLENAVRYSKSSLSLMGRISSAGL